MAFLSGVLLATHTFITFLLIVAFDLKSGHCDNVPRILHEPKDFYNLQDKFYGLEYKIQSSESLTYEWYHNGTLINKGYTLDFVVFDRHDLRVLPLDVNQRYQGTYQLFISFSHGKIFGRKITVKFKVFGHFLSEDIKETRQVTIGQPYSLECPKHSYSTDCLYKWGYHSPASGLRHVIESSNRIILENGTLFFSSILEEDVRDFSPDSEGISCILECTWCSEARMSHGIVLEAKPGIVKAFGPTLNSKLEDKEVLLGTSFVVLTCAAQGNPAPVYRWVKIDDEKGEQAITTGTNRMEFGPFNHSLILNNVTESHNGTYRCIISSNNAQVNDSARIIVREKPEWSTDGMITSQSLDVFTNLTWECKANGDPSPNITWYANATKLSTTDKRSYVVNGGKITFSRLLVEDTGIYECVAENGFGYIYQTAALYVRAQRPQFTERNTTRVLLVGTEATLRCECDAIPAANYTWMKDRIRIDFLKTEKYHLYESRNLVIKQITDEDSGLYECIATNVFGEDKQTTDVTIDDISFVLAPNNMENITQGSMISLYCKAKSFFRIKYKWKFENTELVYGDKYIWLEKANRLIIRNAEEADSGTYECIAYIDDPARVERTRKALIIVQGPPRQLKEFRLLENCTNSSALLAWKPLEIYNHTKTHVIIEWQTTYDPRDRWHRDSLNKINARLGQTRVKNLTPWSQVRFRGVSLNKFGFGEPSEETQFKKCKTPPAAPVKCPENLHGVPDPPDKLIIRWKKLELIDLNGPGFNYTLKYRRSDEETWKKVVLARTVSQFTILNAGVNKLWHFKIRTLNNVGLGPTCLENSSWSNREIANKSKPSAILDLQAKEIKDTSVILAWSTDSGENIDRFRLHYWHAEQNSTRSKREVHRNDCGDETDPCYISIDGKLTEYTLSSLVPSSNHTVSLRAYNDAGYGPAKYISFMTAPATSARLSGSTNVHRRGWFITIITITCFLIVIVLILFILRKRSERYPVRKRERDKGGVKNYDDYNEPAQTLDINGFANPLGMYPEEPEPDEDVNSVSFSDDRYDDDGSFIGEYGDGSATSNRKYEERFV